MPATTIGAILFLVALFARFEGKIPKTRAWMFFGAGATLGAGFIDQVVVKVVHELQNVTNVTTARLWGTAMPLLLLVGLMAWLFFKLLAKGSSGHSAADFLMFILPAVLLAAGGSWALWAGDANHATTAIGNEVITLFQSLAVGL